MRSKTRSLQDKVSIAIQAYIDAYDERSHDTNPGEIFLALPAKINHILEREVPPEHLIGVIRAIQKRGKLVTVH